MSGPYETPEEAAVAEAAPDAPMIPEFRQRLLAAVGRPLRVRHEILLLAGHASGHLMGPHGGCRRCHLNWPCEDVKHAAAPALEAFAETAPDPHGGGGS